MNRCQFTNPANGDTYVWPWNPGFTDETQYYGKQRQIDRESNTGNVGETKQQGDDGPFIIHIEPHVYSEAFEIALWQWWQLCKSQTIRFTDVGGDVYEGQIVTLQKQRYGALGGLPGDVNSRGFFVQYTFEFEVYSFVSGIMATAGVTA